MSSNIKIFLLCPVPEDQKPINEYIGLKENLVTSWTTLSIQNYTKKILSIFFGFFLFVSIFQISGLQGKYYLFEWILENLFLTSLLLLVLFLIILSRWLQIYSRFQTARLFYEEASWYDGQMWEKPLLLIKNDQLLSTQKIRPIFKRIQFTLIQIFSLNFFLFFLLKS
jgi:hypothetical protein